MLGNEALPFRGAPRDAAHDAPVLPERHLEMPFFHAPRTVHDLHTARSENGARVAGAEWGKHQKLRCNLLVDRPEREHAIDPDPGPQIVGTEAAVGILVDPRAQFPDAASFNRQS